MREKSSTRFGLWFATLLSIIAAACGPSVPARTVAYFRTHAKEREALVKRCADDPGTLGKTPECVNVEQAEAIEGIGSFRNLPPLHFPSTPRPATKP